MSTFGFLRSCGLFATVISILIGIAQAASPPPTTQGCDGEVARDCRGWKSAVYDGPEGQRPYSVYIPAGVGPGAPLVVMLHGCTQYAREFAVGTRMNFVADAGKFVVLYPEQTVQAHPARCWNWYLPTGQRRNSGELGLLAAMVRRTQIELRLDPRRTFVAGMSAGAAMTSNLVNCYPEAFAGGAIHSGLPYLAARSGDEAHRALEKGPVVAPAIAAAAGYACAGGKPGVFVPTLILHGTDDATVRSVNGAAAVIEHLELDDLRDDGQANNSVRKDLVKRTDYAASGARHPYRMTEYGPGGSLGALIEVKGMPHAWSGGSPRGSCTDPNGPDASKLIWEFFQRHVGGGYRR